MGKVTMAEKHAVDKVQAEMRQHIINFSYETMTDAKQAQWFIKMEKFITKLDAKLTNYNKARGR